MATNGIELEVREQGEGPLVLLLHGFPEGARSWRHQLAALADAGFRAVAPNLRGYAGSDAPEAIDAYDLVTLAGDVAGLIDALGGGPAAVVGHDWGALVAYHAALLHDDRVRAVAGLSVPWSGRPMASPLAILRALFKDRFFYILHFQEPGVAEAELAADTRRALRMIFYSASGDAPDATIALDARVGTAPGFLATLVDPPAAPAWMGEAELDGYAADFARAGFRSALNWYRNFDRTWTRTAALAGAKIRQPALFVAGDRDPVLSWSRGQLNSMATAVPNLRQVMLPGCGHWTQQERPEAVNQILLEFLRGLS